MYKIYLKLMSHMRVHFHEQSKPIIGIIITYQKFVKRSDFLIMSQKFTSILSKKFLAHLNKIIYCEQQLVPIQNLLLFFVPLSFH